MSDAITARECGKCKLPQYPRACRCEVEALEAAVSKLVPIAKAMAARHMSVGERTLAWNAEDDIYEAESLLRKRGDDE